MDFIWDKDVLVFERMISVVVDALMMVIIAFGLGLTAIGIYLFRDLDRREPGVVAFVTFCGLVGFAGIATGMYGLYPLQFLGRSTTGPNTMTVWYNLASGVLYLVPIPFGVFALKYTGRGQTLGLSPVSKGCFAAAIATVPVSIWIGILVPVAGLEFPLTAVVAYFTVRIGVTLLSLAVFFSSVALILYTSTAYNHIPTGQGISLAGSVSVPLVLMWMGYGFLLMEDTLLELIGIAAIAACFGTCLLCVFLSVFRFETFRNTPAAGSVGRETLIEEMDDLVIVADYRGHVSEMNPAAEAALADSPREPLGQPISEVLGVGLDRLRSPGSIELSTTDGRRQYDPNVSDMSDQHGRGLGAVITLRDVTRREIREQRLSVLNRVLRHNLRNKLSIVKGTANIMAERQESQREAANRLGEAADELVSLGEKAREIEQLMRENHPEEVPVELSTVLADVVRDVAHEYPEVEFRTNLETNIVMTGDEGLVRHLLSNVVENAAEHNTATDPRVDVSIQVDHAGTAPVEIYVADNGPGIPEEEWAVIQDGEETPLEHTSGLGLWAANWCVTRLGGDLSFEQSPYGGALVAIELPETSPSHTMSVDATTSTVTASGD